ncbi:protein AF-9-like isoform X2 [Centruroides sculpturatus]|uniref:protein AF-9-like isoform X2 n=1 Tax=Centruroides sculpturatus TaxID=218467 RepID=UPI000C6DED95|nr:protein AF-9-like isoform X2 [Centruroides sculpturatus]
MENSSTSVVVKLELGHLAFLRSHPTQDGFTHDWTVFVRGIDGNNNIHHFIDKVVFYLHESFPKPKRVVKEPPYQVSESGYAGFTMPIEVYFKNKEEPKKVNFEYDLYLRLEGPPVNHIRQEKLTFQNPVDDFRKKLLKAGGTASVANGNGGNAATVQTHSTSGYGKGDGSLDNQKLTVTKLSTIHAQEKKKQHSVTKESGNAVHQSGHKSSSNHKSLKTSTNAHSSGGVQNAAKDCKSARVSKEKSFAEKETKEQKPVKSGKHPEKEGKQSGLKRHTSPPFGRNAEGIPGKKRPRSASTSSENSSVLSAAGDRKDGCKTKSKESKSKDKRKNRATDEERASSKKERSKDKAKSSKHKKATPEPGNGASPDVRKTAGGPQETERCKTPEEPQPPLAGEAPDLGEREEAGSSPSSSLSLSPVPPGGSHGPLATMMAEMEKDLLSPLSSDPPSPVRPDSPPPEPGPEPDRVREEAEAVPVPAKEEEAWARSAKEEAEKPGRAKKEQAKARKEEGEGNNKSRKEVVGKQANKKDEEEKKKQMESSYLKELVALQRQIMALRDRQLLQKIVDVIEETGRYNISRSSFDFDLCLLDQSTVRKLQSCLTVK